MSAKTMAEVLAEHYVSHADWDEREVAIICHCGAEVVGEDDGEEAYLQEEALYVKHLAIALTAAGFGLVADAKAEALEEAADWLRTGAPEDQDEGTISLWLRDRAKTERKP